MKGSIMKATVILLTVLCSGTLIAATDVLVVAKWSENLESAERVAEAIERTCGATVAVAVSRYAEPEDLAALARHSGARSIVLVGNGVSMPSRPGGVAPNRSSIGSDGESPFANDQFRRESRARQLPFESESFRKVREELIERGIRFSTVLTTARPHAMNYEGARRLAEATGGTVLSRGENVSRLGCGTVQNASTPAAADRVIVLVDDPSRVGGGTNRNRARGALEAVMKDCASREIAIVRYDPRVASVILMQSFTTDRQKLMDALDEALEIRVRRIGDDQQPLEREFVPYTLRALEHLSNQAKRVGATVIVHLGAGIPIRGELQERGRGELTRTDDAEYDRFRRIMNDRTVRYIAFETVPILGSAAAAAREIASATGGEFVPIGKTPSRLCNNAELSARRVYVVAQTQFDVASAEDLEAQLKRCGADVTSAMGDVYPLPRAITTPATVVLVGEGIDLSAPDVFGNLPHTRIEDRGGFDTGYAPIATLSGPIETDSFRTLKEAMKERGIRFHAVSTGRRRAQGSIRLAAATGGRVETSVEKFARVWCASQQ